MLKQKSSPTSIQLCSKCLSYEIESWIGDNWKDINDEARKKIVEELKTIKLEQGECLVCSNSLISDNTIERVYEILNETNVSEEKKKEFQRLFGINV